jgi:hypothetical protein
MQEKKTTHTNPNWNSISVVFNLFGSITHKSKTPHRIMTRGEFNFLPIDRNGSTI